MVKIEDCDKLTLFLADGREIAGYFCDGGCDTRPPQGYERYAIRHSDDDDREFATLEEYVMVNRAGFFYTSEHIEFPAEDNYLEIDDWDFSED